MIDHPSILKLLELLRRDELVGALDRFGLSVHDRRVRSQIINALMVARQVTLAGVLIDLPRERLKTLCRALGVDERGRKSLLVHRLDGVLRERTEDQIQLLPPKSGRTASQRGRRGKHDSQSCAVPSPIGLGTLSARQCVGSDPDTGQRIQKHDKQFLGIADIAGMDYCEIQATISQMRSQEGYEENAMEDDRTGGIMVRPSSPRSIQEDERLTALATSAAALDELSRATRQLSGHLVEQLETSFLPSERRHWDLGEFMLIGIPDGIGDGVVVEVAASRHPKLSVRTKAIQANIYAVLWNVPRYHAISRTLQNDIRREVKEDADPFTAGHFVARAWALFSGREPPKSPSSPNKCKPCKESKFCPYPREKRVPTVEEMQRIAVSRDE